MFLIWLLSPQVATHFIQQQLTPQQLTLAGQSHVRYNPFLSTVTIEEFAITKDKSIVLAIKNAQVGISLYHLLFDRVYIKQFELDGLFIKVRQDDHLEEVAGFELPKEQSTPANEPTNPVDYQIVIPQLIVKNANIGYESNGRKLEFMTKYLTAKKVAANSKEQTGAFQLNGKLAQGKITLSGDFNLLSGQGSINSDIDISKLDMSLFSPWLPASNKLNSGLLSLSGKQQTHILPNKTDIELSNSQFQLKELAAIQDKVALTVDQQEFYAPKITVQLTDKNALTVSGQGKYNLDHLALSNAENKQSQLASIRNVSLPVINIATNQLIPTINFPTVEISKIALSDELTTDLPPILAIENSQLTDVNINANKAEINTITLAGLAVDTHINDQKEVSNLQPVLSLTPKEVVEENTPTDNAAQKDPTAPKEAVMADTSKEKPSSSNNFQLVLNQLSFATPANINLVDASINPNYQRQYTIDTLTLGPVDNYQPALETVLTLVGTSNEHEKFDLKSVNKLFAKKPSYSLKGNIDEIDLSAISPYIKDALSHGIKSGQLNVAIDTQINDNQLSGDADVLIRHIEFKTQLEEVHDTVNTTASMPLNIALNMLKDSSGNVELSIPLSGDVNSPEFGIMSLSTFLIKKASMMAAKDYLMQTFVPYANVVSIAMSAADIMLKVRFNDLTYLPKQTALIATNDTYIQQFSQLLIDKPDTHVTICPIAVPEDISLKSGTEITAKAQIDQLNSISRKRFNLFKRLMHEQYKIKTSRLILCTPSIDSSENAQPRLSFTS